jgi:hypothetical protein
MCNVYANTKQNTVNTAIHLLHNTKLQLSVSIDNYLSTSNFIISEKINTTHNLGGISHIVIFSFTDD